MKFPILETYKPDNSKPKPKQATKTIPFKYLIDFIDDIGDRIADDESLTTDQKIKEWIAILKWAIPFIPKEHEKSKNIIQDAIRNPSEKDFMRPKAK